MVLKRWMTPLACALALSALGCEDTNTGGGDGGVAGAGGEGGAGAGGAGGMGAGGEGGMGAGGEGGMGAGGMGGMGAGGMGGMGAGGEGGMGAGGEGGMGGMGGMALDGLTQLDLPSSYLDTVVMAKGDVGTLVGLARLDEYEGESERHIAGFEIRAGQLTITDAYPYSRSVDEVQRDGTRWAWVDEQGAYYTLADGDADLTRIDASGLTAADGTPLTVLRWRLAGGRIVAQLWQPGGLKWATAQLWPGEPRIIYEPDENTFFVPQREGLLAIGDTVCWTQFSSEGDRLLCSPAAGDIAEVDTPSPPRAGPAVAGSNGIAWHVSQGLSGSLVHFDQPLLSEAVPSVSYENADRPPEYFALDDGRWSLRVRFEDPDGSKRTTWWRTDGSSGGTEVALEVAGQFSGDPIWLGNGRSAWVRQLDGNPPIQSALVIDGTPPQTIDLPMEGDRKEQFIVLDGRVLSLGQAQLWELEGGQWRALSELPRDHTVTQFDDQLAAIWWSAEANDGPAIWLVTP